MPAIAAVERDVEILSRVLANNDERFPASIAKYLLTLGFDEQDKNRMHELAVRNQEDGLSENEKAELHAYARMSTVLSIIKSKARRQLNVRSTKKFDA
ncbi:MAG: hypothetical protein EXS16_01110 [Gemmataceae bacterium]|nr:hypothetical protein [Gemmataceae bacterium]